MKDIALHILDIAQNSIRARATLVEISIVEDILLDLFSITIKDNGSGISSNILEHVTDPFYTSRTTRKVGLGLSLLKQNAERCEGSFTINSAVNVGTIVVATFKHSHIDRPVLGDIAGVVVILVTSNPEMDFVYSHRYNQQSYVFSTVEVREVLEGVPLSDLSVSRFLKEMIKENLEAIKIGV
ncbi:MAG TPA: ATP-binding protein [Williamwhitmania sp.]|nr:ATP-binding protein [Williamwhitmania sp.]